MKRKSTKLNPTHKTVFQPQTSLYRNKPNAIPPWEFVYKVLYRYLR